jgi:hypothetical protein
MLFVGTLLFARHQGVMPSGSVILQQFTLQAVVALHPSTFLFVGKALL